MIAGEAFPDFERAGGGAGWPTSGGEGMCGAWLIWEYERCTNGFITAAWPSLTIFLFLQHQVDFEGEVDLETRGVWHEPVHGLLQVLATMLDRKSLQTSSRQAGEKSRFV